MQVSTTARFYFDTLPTAAEGLILVLKDARTTKTWYRIEGTSVQQILLSGLVLTGDIEAVATKLVQLPGVVRHDE